MIGMLPNSGKPATASLQQNFDELNKNLRLLNKAMCCTPGGGGNQFNTAESTLLNPGDNITIPAGTAHIVSYSIISGAADVTVGTTTNNIPACFSETIEASGLIDTDITISATTGQTYVTIIKP